MSRIVVSFRVNEKVVRRFRKKHENASRRVEELMLQDLEGSTIRNTARNTELENEQGSEWDWVYELEEEYGILPCQIIVKKFAPRHVDTGSQGVLRALTEIRIRRDIPKDVVDILRSKLGPYLPDDE